MVQAYAEIVKMFSSFNSLDVSYPRRIQTAPLSRQTLIILTQYAGRVEMQQYYDAGFAIGMPDHGA
jgi:hypothetical protein